MTRRTPQLQQYLDNLARKFGFTPELKSTLDIGSDHPFGCTCPVCAEWWKTMGPDEDGRFGPFGTVLPDGTKASDYLTEVDPTESESEPTSETPPAEDFQ